MSSVVVELDAIHIAANGAFERGDFDAYREFFTPDLSYRRADGRVVGRDSMMRDARTQFRRHRARQKSIVRETLDVDGDRVTEVVIRTATACGTAFFVVHRVFEYVVRGQFTWRKVDGRWRIAEIEVLEQRVRGPAFLRPSHPPRSMS